MNIYQMNGLYVYNMFLLQMFQVVQPSRALYVQASNCIEEKEWLVYNIATAVFSEVDTKVTKL
jgi:hypothetical protein